MKCLNNRNIKTFILYTWILRKFGPFLLLIYKNINIIEIKIEDNIIFANYGKIVKSTRVFLNA